MKRIIEIHRQSDYTYDSPRIHDALTKQGIKVNRKTAEKHMQQHDISPVLDGRFIPQATDSNHDHPVAENLLGQPFSADAPNLKLVTDITYVWTDEG